jgi:hypothetical protein
MTAEPHCRGEAMGLSGSCQRSGDGHRADLMLQIEREELDAGCRKLGPGST